MAEEKEECEDKVIERLANSKKDEDKLRGMSQSQIKELYDKNMLRANDARLKLLEMMQNISDVETLELVSKVFFYEFLPLPTDVEEVHAVMEYNKQLVNEMCLVMDALSK
jgi:hypothetical protein